MIINVHTIRFSKDSLVVETEKEKKFVSKSYSFYGLEHMKDVYG